MLCSIITPLKFNHTSRNNLLNWQKAMFAIDHFRDLQTDSQTTDITHFAVVFHYDVTIESLEILRSTAKKKVNAYDVIMKNNGKVLDVRSLACQIKVLNGRVTGTWKWTIKDNLCYTVKHALMLVGFHMQKDTKFPSEIVINHSVKYIQQLQCHLF